MNFLKAKLFVILCFAVVALGVGLFVFGYLISGKNKVAIQEIERQVQGASTLGSQLVSNQEITKLTSLKELAEKKRDSIQERIKATSSRPVLHEEVLKEDIGDDRYGYYRRFADQYTMFMDKLVVQMGGGDRPTEAEEEQIRQERQEKIRLQRGLTGATANESEQSQLDKLIVDERKSRAETISIYATPSIFCCYNHWIGQPSDTDHNAMLQDIWYTQVAAWIQEDIVGVVKQFNGESTSVYKSPVKRLVGISFNGEAPSASSDQSGSGTGSRTSGSVSSRAGQTGPENNPLLLPQYVIPGVPTVLGGALAGAPPAAGGAYPPAMGGGYPPAMGGGYPPAMGGGYPPAMGGAYPPAMAAGGAVPPTGAVPTAAPAEGGMTESAPPHASDNLVHVVHFSLTVMIDSSKIHDFINAIQTTRLLSSSILPDDNNQYERNQISVLQLEVDPVDISMENEQGYYYGSASVKRLTLICEYLFFQSGYAEVMPSSIKSLFGPVAPGSD